MCLLYVKKTLQNCEEKCMLVKRMLDLKQVSGVFILNNEEIQSVPNNPDLLIK